jgi:hypothetical protein
LKNEHGISVDRNASGFSGTQNIFRPGVSEFLRRLLAAPRMVKISIGAFRPLNGHIEPIIDEIGSLSSGGLGRVAGAGQ